MDGAAASRWALLGTRWGPDAAAEANGGRFKDGGYIPIRTLGTGEEDGQGRERLEAGESSGENDDVEPGCFFTSFTVNWGFISTEPVLMMKRKKMVSVCVLINLCQLEKNDARLGFSKEKNLNSQGARLYFSVWEGSKMLSGLYFCARIQCPPHRDWHLRPWTRLIFICYPSFSFWVLCRSRRLCWHAV